MVALTDLARPPSASLALRRRLVDGISSIPEAATNLTASREESRERIDAAIERADALDAVGSRTAAQADELLEVGRRTAALAERKAAISEATLDQNRDTIEALRALDTHLSELLVSAGAIEGELPAQRAAFKSMYGLTGFAEALSGAAPPIQAAAQRVENIADRFPGAARRRDVSSR